MSQPKIHRWDADLAGGLVRALCGHMPAAHMARGPERQDEVTCKACLRKLAAVPFAPGDLQRDEPWVAPDPKPVDPDRVVWADLPARVRRLADAPNQSRSRGRMWSSPEDAARFVAALRADGYSAGSASGAVERIGQAGTRVQTSGRAENRSTQQAGAVADVEVAVKRATARLRLPEGVSVELALRVWRDARVGRPLTAPEWAGRTREERTHFVVDDTATVAGRYGLDAGLVTAVALEVHRALYAEMRDRGLCPGGGVRT